MFKGGSTQGGSAWFRAVHFETVEPSLNHVDGGRQRAVFEVKMIPLNI
jgi:hypothetical protein